MIKIHKGSFVFDWNREMSQDVQRQSRCAHFCLWSVFCPAVIKYWPRTNLGQKGFVWVLLPHYNPSLRAVRAATQEQSEGSNWRRYHGGRLLTGSFFMACFLMQFRIICLGWHHSQCVWFSQINHQSENAPQTCPQASLMDVIPQLRFFLPRWLKLCQLDKNYPAQLTTYQLDTNTLLSNHRLSFLICP